MLVRRDSKALSTLRLVAFEGEASFGLYGMRKVWHQLRHEGMVIAKCTVGRLVAGMGLAGVPRGKNTITTVGESKTPCPLDKANLDFPASRPNALWVFDFIHAYSWAGFVYVLFVIDAYARRIVGWNRPSMPEGPAP